MKKWVSLLLLSSASALSLAAPQGPDYAAMDTLLIDRGLMSRLGTQIEAARDSMSERASGLVVNAMGFLGVPYRFGGNDKESGVDCSGFVRAVYEQSVGLLLPRRSAEQADATETIDRSELKPGDLVFFNTMKRTFSHVGIYLGDGKFIHAPRTGAHVRVEDMRVAYWNARFNGARRVPLLAANNESTQR